jgi:hypothetical protein
MHRVPFRLRELRAEIQSAELPVLVARGQDLKILEPVPVPSGSPIGKSLGASV